MPFTAQIVFTGICGLIPKKDPPNPPEGFRIVLPNAWKLNPDPREMKKSLDGLSLLRRHVPFVTFANKARDTTNQRQDLAALWYLQGHRLVFTPTGTPSNPAWDIIGGLASFDDIVSAADRALLSVHTAATAPALPQIAAQVILRYGKLSSLPSNLVWVIDDYLRPQRPIPRNLNHQFVVTLDNLTSLEVELQTFAGGSTGNRFTFTNAPAVITVANLCDQNPLQWGKKPPPASIPDDDDFRWHYEIVDNRTALQDALKNLRCPIPRLTHTLSGGGGLNCVPIRFPEVNVPL